MTVLTKRCNRCAQVKLVSEYYKGSERNRYGVLGTCKACKAEQRRDALIQSGRPVRRQGRDVERKRAMAATRYAARRDVLAAEARARMAALRASPEGRDRANASARKYKASKRATDPGFVVNARISRQVLRAIGDRKAGRPWESLLGYSLSELVEHLNRQIPKGYSLVDLGSKALHIDHIVPLTAFDVSTAEGVRAAWALSNLRPVEARVNLSKGARRLYLV